MMDIFWTKEELMNANQKLLEKVKRYEKALKFYSDERSYVTDIKGMKIEATVMQDNGEFAKSVLKGDR